MPSHMMVSIHSVPRGHQADPSNADVADGVEDVSKYTGIEICMADT